MGEVISEERIERYGKISGESVLFEVPVGWNIGDCTDPMDSICDRQPIK